jgi:tetratricopeptide (TPR) repeat protein
MVSLFFILCGIAYTPVFTQEHPKGLELFQKAYSLEKSDPQGAARLYNASIAAGLDHKLTVAARWKLYYIYKNSNNFFNAIPLLSLFGSGSQIDTVKEDLYTDIRHFFNISREGADQYSRGILLLVSKEPRDAVEPFRNAIRLNPFSSVLKKSIIALLNEAGLTEEAMRLARESSGNPVEASLQEADILVKRGKFQDAKRILENVSSADWGMDDDAKGRILYLLGRVERDQGNVAEAISYFRMAGRYSNGEALSRQLSLAAYGLMQLGLDIQAYALVKKIQDSKDGNVHLIRLILHCSPGNILSSCEELRKYRSGFRSDPSFLSQRALRLIDELPAGKKDEN